MDLGGRFVSCNAGLFHRRISLRLASQQVKRFAEALAGISPSDLLARYDPDKMTALDLYPSVIWSRDPQDELKELLADSFESLRSFVQEAAARKLGLIV